MSGAEIALLYGTVAVGCVVALTIGALVVIIMVTEVIDDAKRHGWN